MSSITAIEVIVQRDRIIVAAGLAIVCLLSWGWLLFGAGTGMNIWLMMNWGLPPTPGDRAMGMPWNISYFLLMLVMWWVMMIAMMLPGAAPIILLYARVARRANVRGQMHTSVIPTSYFAAGYLVAWLAFSLIATGLQWELEQAGLVNSMTMASSNKTLSVVLLVGIGLYQFTPVKNRCIEHCRAPADYLSKHWQNGAWGAFRMGAVHGTYCVGCCWALMGLLFVGGAMNLAWIGVLTLYVAVEKFAPFGNWTACAVGLVLIASGGLMLG